MQNKFHIGQKVICLHSSTDAIVNVIKGQTYTFEGYTCGGRGILVKEAISNRLINGFWIWRFAPVENIKVEWSEIANKDLVLN